MPDTTKVADLWVPSIWIPAVREKKASFPSLLNSGVIIQTSEMDAKAEGAGLTVNVPMWKDITDQDDEVQVEDQGPASQKITAGLQVAPMLNRVTKNSSTALSAAVSGGDPADEMQQQVVDRRDKQRQKTGLAIVRGCFGTAGVKDGAASLSAVRYVGPDGSECFVEDAQAPAAENLFGPEMFIKGKALMGELQDDLRNGVIWMHSTVKARLEILDKDGFKTGKASDLPFDITTYRGVPIVLSDGLVRAATGNGGYVYETYLLAKGIMARGEAAQKGDVIDVSSLQFDEDKDKNNAILYDRTRFLLHLNFTKWVGNPASDSASNAELQTAANWTLIAQTANRCGAVAFRTNG